MESALRLSFIVIFALLNIAPHFVAADVLRYSVDSQSDWVPYSKTGQAGYPGIFPELSKLILERAKIKSEPIDVPTKRAIKLLEEGHIDFDWVNPDWFPEGKVGEGLVTSAPIFVMTEYVISLSKNANKYRNLSDIYGKVVGTIRGFYYFDDSDFVRMDFSSEEALIRGLQLNRFEAAILEEMTARYWSRRLNVDIQLVAVHTSGEIVLRMRAEHQHLLKDINQAINYLRASGEIEAVKNKYREIVFVPPTDN